MDQQDKIWDVLMMFNELHEPCIASPESWHLSRIYYIHSIITFTQVENISCELHLSRVIITQLSNIHNQYSSGE